jgi:hypothetical protein
MDLEQTPPGPKTVTAAKAAKDAARAASASPKKVSYGAQDRRGPLLWNSGLEMLTNRTRLPGQPATAGMNLFYEDLEWNTFFGPGDPSGIIPKDTDQIPPRNMANAGRLILPWCSNSQEVRQKAILVYRLGEDLDTIEDPLLYLFQYYWDNVGYFLPVTFGSFFEKVSMGEGPSSSLNVDFILGPAGDLVARAWA